MQLNIISFPILFLSCLLTSNPAIPQQVPKVFRECLRYVDDSIVKKEVAYFTNEGRFNSTPKPYARSKVNEIKVSSFTDTSATFSTKEFTIFLNSTSFDTIGHSFTQDSTDWPLLKIDGILSFGTFTNIPKTKIKSVNYVHNNIKLTFPEKAIAGIYEPGLVFYNDKGEILKSMTEYPRIALCKVFQSLDKRRIYIYMENSDAMAGYELTWVIQDDKYLRRIIDF